MMFAVIVTSLETRYQDKTIATPAGMRFWVTKGEWGPSSSQVVDDKPARDLLVFTTREAAEKFVKPWCGHPWWCKPSGVYEIVEVKPRMIKVQYGFERA